MIHHILRLLLLLLLAALIPIASAAQEKPNILFISVDDMNCDSSL